MFHNPRGSMPQTNKLRFPTRVYCQIAGGGVNARRLWNTVVATVFHNPRGSMPKTNKRRCALTGVLRNCWRRRQCTEIVEHGGGHSVPQPPWKHAANNPNPIFHAGVRPTRKRRRHCTEVVEHGGGHSVQPPSRKHVTDKKQHHFKSGCMAYLPAGAAFHGDCGTR